jgi:hypothetical protein
MKYPHKMTKPEYWCSHCEMWTSSPEYHEDDMCKLDRDTARRRYWIWVELELPRRLRRPAWLSYQNWEYSTMKKLHGLIWCKTQLERMYYRILHWAFRTLDPSNTVNDDEYWYGNPNSVSWCERYIKNEYYKKTTSPTVYALVGLHHLICTPWHIWLWDDGGHTEA